MSHPTATLALLDALHEKWHQRFMALSAKDSEKRVGQAVSEAANDLGDIIEAYESERLASDEPADQIRTLPEAISSRIVIPPASFSFEMTSDGISPDLYAILTGHPVAVEDDDAVPRPEPAEITEEPPVDSQVSVAQRDLVADELWNQMIGVAKSAMRDAMEEAFDVAGIAVADSAPLRPTTDADRERVGLPVEPAPADVDPDEALAKVLCDVDAGDGGLSWDEATESRDAYRQLARVAREHIEDSLKVYYRDLYGKAEADLARVTDARDRHSRAADKWCNLYADKCEEIESVQAKADRYDALRADVEGDRKGWGRAGSDSFTGRFIAHAMGCILARDTERAES